MIDLKALAAPFPVNQIEWRIGSTNGDKTSGIALAYIDARLVMERLDAVCGMENWQNKHPHANGKTSCSIGIKIDGEWVWKENGAGDSQVEAEKGAFSDSFKRAAVQWGIGRYLYDMPNVWVEIEPAGRSHKIKASEYKKLEAGLNRLMTEKFGTQGQKNLANAVSMMDANTSALSQEEKKKLVTESREALESVTDLTELSSWKKQYDDKIRKNISNYHAKPILDKAKELEVFFGNKAMNQAGVQ